MSKYYYAQNSLDIIEKLSIDTTDIYSRIENDCFKNTKLSDKIDLKIFVFYKFEDNACHDKQDYVDGSYLDSLSLIWYQPKMSEVNSSKKCVLHKKNKEVSDKDDLATILLDIDAYTVTDNNGVIIGMGGDIYSRCLNVPYDTALVFSFVDPTTYQYSKKMDFIFRTRNKMKDNKYLYGINKNEGIIYVIVDTRFGSEIFTIEEIVTHHWDDFQNGLPILYEEVREKKKAEFEKK